MEGASPKRSLRSLPEPLVDLDRRPQLLVALQNFFELHLRDVVTEANLFSHVEALTSYLCGSCSPTKPSSRHAVNGFDPDASLASPEVVPAKRRRVLLTGCFDLMHAGHYNALRQAKAAFPSEEVTLVAGVHSDEAILRAKGAPTVLRHDERVELLQSCRWVDEVVGSLPYAVPVDLLDRLTCDVAVHGDDLPKVPGGGGLFDEVMAAGRMHIVKRTEGTSTTMLIGRLLSMSKDHLLSRRADEEPPTTPQLVSEESKFAAIQSSGSDRLKVEEAPAAWTLLPTMSRMSLFYANRQRSVGTTARVVYAPGEWDLFHVGHVRFLKAARSLGDFLIVGCYGDDTIHKKKGKNYPLQTLHERALNVLACRYVDDVLLGAPWQASLDLLTTLNVSVLVTGHNNLYAEPLPEGQQDLLGLRDPFLYARSAGILRIIDSECELTMDVIAERILSNMSTYLLRQSVKENAEKAYNDSKGFVAEK